MKKVKKVSDKTKIRRLNGTLEDTCEELRLSLARNEEYRRQLQAKQTEEFIWVCADGRRMALAEMEESHLRNTICYLQRRLASQFGTVRYLSKLKRDVRALYEMLKEADRRQIEV